MIYVMGAIAALVIWFWWAKKRGDGHAREVYRMTVSQLTNDGIPAGAIKAFTTGVTFDAIARGSFGKKSVYDAYIEAIDAFFEQQGRYRELGIKYNGDIT